MTHRLKTLPLYFAPVARGEKTVEIRKNDRPFAVGDILQLCEYDHDQRRYTGRYCFRRITHILPGGLFGLEEGYVALSIAPLSASVVFTDTGMEDEGAK